MRCAIVPSSVLTKHNNWTAGFYLSCKAEEEAHALAVKDLADAVARVRKTREALRVAKARLAALAKEITIIE